MKKLIIFLLALMPFSLSAQQQIKGIVTDQNGQPLDGVTIILSKDNKNVFGGLTDMGNFTLNLIQDGSYQVSATLIGYKPATQALTLPAANLKIVMQSDSKILKEVTISGSKPMIERKVDRVIFNVEQSIIANGGSAWEALSKAPGVQLTSSGTVTANKKDVELYLDGKPLHLSSDDLSAYLQGIPSDMISKIEVFSTPPANFEAEGSSVINIVTKKSKGQGFNATVNGGITQAKYGSYIAGNTFNYRKDKLNIYGGYSFTSRKNGYERHDYVVYNNPENYAYWDSPGYSIYHSKTNNYRLGADYQITGRQILGFLITGNNRSNNMNAVTQTSVTNNFKNVPDSTLQTNGISSSHGNQYAYNLNYNIKLDTSGQSLNLDLDYSPYKTVRNQYVDNLSFSPDGNLTSDPYRIYTPTIQKIDIYSGKLDYNRSLGKSWTLASGFKYSRIKSQNNFDFYNNAGAQPILIAANSNHFDYTENTSGAYASVSGTIGHWNIQAGLRGEYTQTIGHSTTLNSLNKRQYFKLFPTLFTSYKLDDLNELHFNYGYRIERPEYARLNPAKLYTNPYNYLVGNPSLQPAFVQSLELGYTYNKQYNVTAFYTATHDMFSNITVQDDANQVFYNTQQNLGLSLNTGIRVSAPIHINSWWEMNNMLEAFYQREKSAYLQGSYDYDKFAYDGNTTQSFLINKTHGIKAEVSLIYTSAAIQGIYKIGANYSVDAGIKANVLNGQGTIKLSASDIFNTNDYHISVNYLNQNNGFFKNNDTRYGALSFSYRFGKNVAAARKRNAGIDEEKERTQ
ncbi:TonB-dependent receptor domain-containing protein [Pedobacter antarcticus]|uniref:TonB-dependent receptor domain-containing protein n=1 Tax=Pedobacter antarcticus TaxID=34086 RepID=UPI0029307EF2|nr:TonB-dependent receptor [Pedobacter antarcticus]